MSLVAMSGTVATFWEMELFSGNNKVYYVVVTWDVDRNNLFLNKVFWCLQAKKITS